MCVGGGGSCRSETDDVASCVIYWCIFCLDIGLGFGLGIGLQNIRVSSSLDFELGPDLGPNCLQKHFVATGGWINI